MENQNGFEAVSNKKLKNRSEIQNVKIKTGLKKTNSKRSLEIEI